MREAVLLLWVFICLTQGYYLPGVAPQDYKTGQYIPLTVNSLKSPRNALSFEYFHPLFNFCGANGKFKANHSSIGSVLFGDRIYEARDFSIRMKETKCKHLCTTQLSAANVNFLIDRIRDSYEFFWYIDSLPAARPVLNRIQNQTDYHIGFPLGFHNDKLNEFYLYNHYKIDIQYHLANDFADEDDPSTDFRVVGVIIHGESYKYSDVSVKIECPDTFPSEKFILKLGEKDEVTYTYSVSFKYSDVEWATRWDHYLHIEDPKIHWLSLVNSFAIVLFLTLMVFVILLRALHKDFIRYNQDSVEESQDEYGWKLVHGDVFRTPTHPLLLSVLVGNGMQIFCMSLVTLVLALLGFLSPSIRGSLATVAVVFYVCFGLVAGYTSSMIYKMMGGEAWKRCVILTACLIPGIISALFLFLNFFLIGVQSSAAVPFKTLVGLLSLWMFLSCPLCFFGSYLAFKKPKINFPVRVNQIPRQVPPQTFYLQRVPSILLGGILPFGAIFIEFYFILSSIWLNRIYYVFGFLALVFIVLVATCSEVTILMCYFHLCAEDYRWWWRSFFTAGCSAFYVFVYSFLYYFMKLEMANFISFLLFFGYTLVICIIFFTMTGSVGFLSCLWFTRKIYSCIRID